MVNVIGTASELGYINIPENTLIDIEHLKNYKKEDTVLITTGSQGESLAALSRMAADLHKKVSIMPGDVVALSSTPIPGNGKAVARVINELSMKGAEVISRIPPRVRTCLPGGDQADVLLSSSEILDSGTR